MPNLNDIMHCSRSDGAAVEYVGAMPLFYSLKGNSIDFYTVKFVYSS